MLPAIRKHDALNPLRHIRSFVAVIEEGSFTAAAHREAATQSGISQHIKQLEADLGVPLFERSGRDVTPTPAGRRYYLDCIEVLRSFEMARRNVASDQNLATIRVGLMPTFTRSVLPPVLDKFLALAPGAEVQVIEAYSGVLTDMTLRGELDFAVVPAFEGRRGISHHLIARDREMLVSARGSDHKMKPVRLSDLGALKIVLPGPQNTRRRNIETYLSAHAVTIARRLEMDAMMGTLQFIASSDWVAILPFIMMVGDLDRDQFTIRPLDQPPLHSEFVLIEPSRRLMSAAATTFAELLKAEAELTQSVFQQRLMV